MHHNISLLLPLLSLQPATYCILFDLGTTLIKCAICKQTHTAAAKYYSVIMDMQLEMITQCIPILYGLTPFSWMQIVKRTYQILNDRLFEIDAIF